jgi:ribosomal-protein-alanine N-acetyltransferase
VSGFAAIQSGTTKPLFAFGLAASAHATNLAIVFNSFALSSGSVSIRVIRMRDWKTIESIQLRNRDWFRKWEATNPSGPLNIDFKGSIRSLLRQLDDETCIPFVIEFEGRLVGQLNISNILYGSVLGAFIGYWIDPEYAGRGITPTAVALAIDYAFSALGLHRIEIDIKPENQASIRVVEKLGMRLEGTKKNFIHINNAWSDHLVFAITAEEVPRGILQRLNTPS